MILLPRETEHRVSPQFPANLYLFKKKKNWPKTKFPKISVLENVSKFETFHALDQSENLT